MTEYTIREARRQDVPAIVALWKEMMDFHEERDPRFRFAPNAAKELERHLVSTLKSSGARIFIAQAGARVIGYVLGEVHLRKPIYPVGNYGFISDLAVTAAWRRRGVGRELAAATMSWFRDRGVTSVELFVSTANPDSTAFWRAMGFGDYLQLLRKEIG